MTKFQNRVLHSLVDRDGALTISSIACNDCEFANCGLSLTKEIGRRSTVSDVSIENCRVSASAVGPAVLRRLKIDGLKTDSLLIIWGAVFDQVLFAGRIGKIKVNRHVHHADQSDRLQKPFDEFRQTFYEQVDWAIDISRAEFSLLELSGIPSRLIRRDPETQMVVTRERALNPDWRRRVSQDSTHWPFAIDMFLATGELDRVLVVPTAGPKKQAEKLLRELQELRALGVVE
jgi:hypothetical protein